MPVRKRLAMALPALALMLGTAPPSYSPPAGEAGTSSLFPSSYAATPAAEPERSVGTDPSREARPLPTPHPGPLPRGEWENWFRSPLLLRERVGVPDHTPPLAKGGRGGVLFRAVRARSEPPSVPPPRGGKPEMLNALGVRGLDSATAAPTGSDLKPDPKPTDPPVRRVAVVQPPTALETPGAFPTRSCRPRPRRPSRRGRSKGASRSASRPRSTARVRFNPDLVALRNSNIASPEAVEVARQVPDRAQPDRLDRLPADHPDPPRHLRHQPARRPAASRPARSTTTARITSCSRSGSRSSSGTRPRTATRSPAPRSTSSNGPSSRPS